MEGAEVLRQKHAMDVTWKVQPSIQQTESYRPRGCRALAIFMVLILLLVVDWILRSHHIAESFGGG